MPNFRVLDSTWRFVWGGVKACTQVSSSITPFYVSVFMQEEKIKRGCHVLYKSCAMLLIPLDSIICCLFYGLLQQIIPPCDTNCILQAESLHIQTYLPFRRGSNVSLVLDMSSLSNTEPILSVTTPRDVTVQLLKSASHVLTQEMLQKRCWNLEELQEEFAVRCSEVLHPGFLLLESSYCPKPRWALKATSHTTGKNSNRTFPVPRKSF